MQATVPYVVATLISDDIVGETAMHHHLVGHHVDSIRKLRTNYGTGWQQWPMVDLWTRVPASEFLDIEENDMRALFWAKEQMNITDEYTGQVGW